MRHHDLFFKQTFSIREHAGDPRCALPWEKSLEPRDPNF